jgi:hypothetical protein
MMTMPSSRFFTASPPLDRHGALSQWLHIVGA